MMMMMRKNEISHLVRRYQKLGLKKKKKRALSLKRTKKGKVKQVEVICFKCKEAGSVRSECLG